MVEPAPVHVLLQVRGRLGTAGQSPETWQIGIRLSPFNLAETLSTVREDYVTDIEAFITGSANFSSSVHLEEVRFAAMGSTGAQEGDTIVHPAQGQGTGATTLPWQCSIVATLAADGRGPGKLGRWFLPPISRLPNGNTGLLDVGDQDAVADAVQTFVQALNNHPGIDTGTAGNVVIVGRTGAAGTIEIVDEIRIGAVIDTHRSRRRSLEESYVARQL